MEFGKHLLIFRVDFPLHIHITVKLQMEKKSRRTYEYYKMREKELEADSLASLLWRV